MRIINEPTPDTTLTQLFGGPHGGEYYWADDYADKLCAVGGDYLIVGTCGFFGGCDDNGFDR